MDNGPTRLARPGRGAVTDQRADRPPTCASVLAVPDSPSLFWDSGRIVMVDQRRLPSRLEHLSIESVEELITAIRTLAVRGAPALGVAGALGVALSAFLNDGPERVQQDAERIAATRPTAVNLASGVARALAALPRGAEAVLDEAQAMIAEDVLTNQRVAARAADAVMRLCGERPVRILTHCNTGRLATVAYGTALGAVRDLAARGMVREVLVGETRPLLQGARLTAWELREAGIPHRLLIDAAATWAMATGQVDCVIVGADRVAANGDVANKIGTLGLAVAAHHHGVPFLVVAPESSCDPATPTGSTIVVEERPDTEITRFGGHETAPAGTETFNPAFDVTPAGLISAVVTERGVVHAHGLGAVLPGVGARLGDRVLARTRVHPDRPGSGSRDLAGLYADSALFADTVHAVAAAAPAGVDRVLAIESRGFVLGAAVASWLGLPLTLARRPGKLPGRASVAHYALEYCTDALQVQAGALQPGERVLVVDDVLATGGTLAAAAEVVRSAGAVVAGMVVVLELGGLGGRRRLDGEYVVAAAEVPA